MISVPGNPQIWTYKSEIWHNGWDLHGTSPGEKPQKCAAAAGNNPSIITESYCQIWEINSKGEYVPVMCLKEPAPKAVLEIVKCGCQGNCDSANCSCLRNGLSCTALCKCSDCSNVQKLSLCEDIDDTDM